MKSKEIEELKEQTKILFKVVDKLENRISTLEKVLASHAKCIGEIRKEKNDSLLLSRACVSSIHNKG